MLVQSRRARLAALSIAGPLQSKEHHASGTPRRRLPASRVRWRRDGACKTAALGDALLRVTIRNIQGRILRFFGRVPNSPESTTPRRPSAFRPAPSPPGKQLHTLLYISTTPIHPLLGRDQRGLAVCKTLAQPALGVQRCSPDTILLGKRTARVAHNWHRSNPKRCKNLEPYLSSRKLPAP